MAFDDPAVAAAGIPVDRVVDAAIADIVFLHAAHHGFKGFQVVGRIAVHLHIGDVPAVGQRMIRRLQADLVKCADVIIHRDME